MTKMNGVFNMDTQTETPTGGDLAGEIEQELKTAFNVAENSPETDLAEAERQQEVITKAEGIAEYKALFVSVLTPAFAIFFPAWGISTKEIDALAEAYAAVCYKYWPEMDLGVEVTAIITTAMVVLPRRHLPRKLPVQPESQPEGGAHE